MKNSEIYIKNISFYVKNREKSIFVFEKIAKKSKNAQNRLENTRACDHTNLANELNNFFFFGGGALGPIYLFGAPGAPNKKIRFFIYFLLIFIGIL